LVVFATKSAANGGRVAGYDQKDPEAGRLDAECDEKQKPPADPDKNITQGTSGTNVMKGGRDANLEKIKLRQKIL
jgi:hypothetical protein